MTKIADLTFPKGCQTIPSALERSGFTYLEELKDALANPDFKWRGVGPIRMKLILNWLDS